MQADDEALERIARRAGGSMRDAQSLLDQLLAFGGERLTSEQVHRLLGTANDERVVALAGAVLDHDAKRALELLAQAADEGLQLGELLDQLVEYWRDLMVLQCAGPDARDLNTSSRHREVLVRQAAALKLDTILAGLDILAVTKSRLRGSNHGRILVEMALVRLGRLDELVSLTELAQWLGGGERPAPERPAAVGAPRPASPAPTVTPPPEAVKKKTLAAPEPPPPTPTRTLSAESMQQVWPEVLAQLPPMLAGQLQKAGIPAIFGPNTLVIRFPAEYNACSEYCQGPNSTARLDEVLRKLTGQAWKLRIESVGGNGAARHPEAAEDTERSPSRNRRQREEAEKEPLIQRAMELLEAQVVRVDDGFGAAPTTTPEGAEAVDRAED